jgi:hypothetical protein
MLLCVCAFVSVARAMAPGWMLIGLFFPYLGIIAMHAAVHWRAAKRVASGAVPLLATASHILLIGAFLLQFDGGDAPIDGEAQYYPLTALLGLGTWADTPAGWVIALNQALNAFAGSCVDGFVRLRIVRDSWAGWSLYELALFLPVSVSWPALLWCSRRRPASSPDVH